MRRLSMRSLASRKLVAVLAAMTALVGLVAFQTLQGGLSDQQFNLVVLAITALGGGNALIQGVVDGLKVKG
jgi:hypothetical protein